MSDLLIKGPMTIFVAPIGTPFPDDSGCLNDGADKAWTMLHPSVPDVPPNQRKERE
jgi:hypothetical protein